MPSNADKSTFLNHNYKEKEATVIPALDDKEQLSFPVKKFTVITGLDPVIHPDAILQTN